MTRRLKLILGDLAILIASAVMVNTKNPSAKSGSDLLFSSTFLVSLLILIFLLGFPVLKGVFKAVFKVTGSVMTGFDKVKNFERDQYYKIYQSALDKLSANPQDPGARHSCLEAGRQYYRCLIPDTYTSTTRGGREVGQSNHQDNTAAREARITNDIESRIGHLRVPRAS